MKKLWFTKGRTGELLREVRDYGPFPITVDVRPEFPGRPMINPAGGAFSWDYSIRGNSKQRRQQRRQIERWLNTPPTQHLCSCGAPAAGCIGYQGDLPDG